MPDLQIWRPCSLKLQAGALALTCFHFPLFSNALLSRRLLGAPESMEALFDHSLLSGLLFMAALCNRAGHIYFHAVVSSSSFFPCLISVVGDWMSTMLPHMVWP